MKSRDPGKNILFLLYFCSQKYKNEGRVSESHSGRGKNSDCSHLALLYSWTLNLLALPFKANLPRLKILFCFLDENFHLNLPLKHYNKNISPARRLR